MSNSITFGLIAETTDYCNYLIEEGHEHAVVDNWREQLDDIAAIKGSSKMFQVSGHSHGKNDLSAKHKLTSNALLHFCLECHDSGTYTHLNLRDEETHELDCKKGIVNCSDNELRQINVTALAMPLLKAQLQARDLSTIHKVKNELIERLLAYLANASIAS